MTFMKVEDRKRRFGGSGVFLVEDRVYSPICWANPGGKRCRKVAIMLSIGRDRSGLNDGAMQ